MKAHFYFYGKQAIALGNSGACNDISELSRSKLFSTIVEMFIHDLENRNSLLLDIFPKNIPASERGRRLVELFGILSVQPKKDAIKTVPSFKGFFRDYRLLHQFVENLYNYWRQYERFYIFDCDEEHKLCYKFTSETLANVNHLARKFYRDICEHITGDRPIIYRQVPSAFQVGVVVHHQDLPLPKQYEHFNEVPTVRHVLINPPLILDPPMNTRSGQFTEVKKNPLDHVRLKKEEWLCYPTRVGELVIYVYVHNRFIGLGTAIGNLFDLASGEDFSRKPDAIYVYGLDESHFGEEKTIFFQDKDMLIGAIPGNDNYGYFGYVKKMMLTLHNIIMMKRNRMPIHGAMVRISLKSGKSANVILVGDSGAGKSESLEAFRILAKDYLRDMTVIFDDMGSIGEAQKEILGYGTETGAFVRLDDLQPGFAFGNIDRSIIMSPQKINARAALPITTLYDITKGYSVDFFLYANNYEEVDDEHPFFESFSDVDEAFSVFKHGARMAKGTTSEKGLVSTYFANPFGPIQFKDMHEKIARAYFESLFKKKVVVGQLRTRLGIRGYEMKGPQEAAKALFEVIMKR